MSDTLLRMFVVGFGGQLSTALIERAGHHGFVVEALGFPDLDLAGPADAVERQVRDAAKAFRAEVIVNAAAYTAVDKAEDEADVAMAINGVAPGAIARAAAALDVPVIHISTDYVFDGAQAGLWREDAPTAPLGVYGRTKLAGENAVTETTDNHAILRTAWVYAPFGANFVKTMLRLAAEGRNELNVVADQIGCPTSVLDIADAVFAVSSNLIHAPQRTDMRGVFHLVGTGEASWAEFAEAIFANAKERGAPAAIVRHIATADYPTKAQRPANSRLDTAKIHAIHGVRLPEWRKSLAIVLDRLIANG